MKNTYSIDEIIDTLKTYKKAPAQTFECVLMFAENLTGISKDELREMAKGDIV